MEPLPRGLFPVMVTPFLPSGHIDYPALRALTEFYIRSGAAGLFAVCQSSEMYCMCPDERLAVARCVVETAAGRVPVVAGGTFEGDLADQIAYVKRMSEVVSAVVVLVCKLAREDEGDDVLLARLQELTEKTPGVPLGLYECPAPYHRLLTLDALKWCAQSQRFVFLKDTCRNNAVISERLAALAKIPSVFRWYNGNVTTMLHSLRAGGHGYGGVSANFYPWVHVWLMNNFEKEPAKAEKVQRFLTVAEALVKTKYPTSAKMYLRQNYPDFQIHPVSRVHTVEFLEEDLTKLVELKNMMEDLCREIGIETFAPPAHAETPEAEGGNGDESAPAKRSRRDPGNQALLVD